MSKADELRLSKAITAFDLQRAKVGRLPGDARKAEWWWRLHDETEELARLALMVAKELEGK